MTRPAVTRLDERVQALQRAFEGVQATRMAGVPLLNPALWVEAVDFEAVVPTDDGLRPDTALGVLITPWFMNLVLLPIADPTWPGAPVGAPVGTAVGDLWRVAEPRARRIGSERFEFIGAHEPSVGFYAACSLFSPMFEFRQQAVARATAQAVLAALRSHPGPSATASSAPVPVPARRAFLLGRTSPA